MLLSSKNQTGLINSKNFNLTKSFKSNFFTTYSDVEIEGNPMVMGFQDEIDDDDFLKPSEFGNPVAQVSDSSDEEPEILQPLPKATVAAPMKVNNFVEKVSTNDDLDDWLNGGEEPSLSSVPTQKFDSFISSEKRGNFEAERLSSPDEPSSDVVEKPIKKHKEKKSKRKSKKSSRESSEMDRNSPRQSRPNNDYEEI